MIRPKMNQKIDLGETVSNRNTPGTAFIRTDFDLIFDLNGVENIPELRPEVVEVVKVLDVVSQLLTTEKTFVGVSPAPRMTVLSVVVLYQLLQLALA